MSEDRKRIVGLRKLVRDTSKKTRAKAEENKTKRKTKAAERERSQNGKSDVFEPKKVESRQTQKKPIKSSLVMSWFRSGIEDAYDGNVILPTKGKMWSYGQRGMANALLDLYQEEEVKAAVLYLCESWQEMVIASDGRLHGLPTINLLYHQHMRIFNEALSGKPYISPQRAKKNRRDSDEYYDDKPVGAEWC